MSNELRSMFDRLERDTVTTFLANAADLRREGSRRRRARALAVSGIAAAAVLVVVLGLNLLPRSPSPAPLGPSPSLATTPSPSPSSPSLSSPSPSASSPTPIAIPDSAFLTIEDTFMNEFGDLEDSALPPICAADLSEPVLRRGMHFAFDDAAVPGTEPFPAGAGSEEIMVFSPGGAAQFMDSLRAAVHGCANDVAGGIPGEFREDAVALPGDAFSFTKIRRFEDQQGPGIRKQELSFSVVRVGDVVLILYITGWEADHPAPDQELRIRDRAVDRFVGWASGL